MLHLSQTNIYLDRKNGSLKNVKFSYDLFFPLLRTPKMSHNAMTHYKFGTAMRMRKIKYILLGWKFLSVIHLKMLVKPLLKTISIFIVHASLKYNWHCQVHSANDAPIQIFIVCFFFIVV
jgi:hypothetical protein